MKRNIKFLTLAITLTALLSGCGIMNNFTETPTSVSTSNEAKQEEPDTSIPAETHKQETENSTSQDTIYPMEYMGIWYGFGTDGTEAQAEFEITSINSNQISINGQTLTFRNSYIAESSIVTAGNGRSSKTLYILGKDSNGDLAIEIYTVDASTNKQFTQSMCCYRQATRENIQDFIPNGEV